MRGFERVLIDLAGFEMFCGIWMIWVDLVRFQRIRLDLFYFRGIEWLQVDLEDFV